MSATATPSAGLVSDDEPMVELHTRVPRRVRDLLQQMAEQDRRTLAFMARDAVCEYAAARAHISSISTEETK